MNIVILAYHPSVLTNWVTKLQPYLLSHQLSVLHIAKLHEVSPISVEGVNLFDVSGYSYKKATSLLRELKPNLFVFLSFRSILELTYQRICCELNINKVYVEHGLFSSDTLKFRKNKLKKEFFPVFHRQFSFLNAHIDYILHSGQVLKELKLFYEVYRKGKFYQVPYDHYFIYSKRSFDNYSKIFNLDENNNVTYIGYPIFNDEVQKKMATVTRGGGVLYVHQPLISDGLANITFREEKDWLIKVANHLEYKYGRFTILLHPRADIDEYKKRFADTKIEVLKAPNNSSLFADKDLIVGHYSTALLYGLYFDKPTIVLDYPTIKNDPLFAEFFTYVDDIENIDNISIRTNKDRNIYMVGEHNTFEYIANRLIQKYDDK